MINSDIVLGSGYRSVAYRVDENELVSSIVSYSSKFIDLPRAFLDNARSGKYAVIEFSTSEALTVERRLSLDGFDAAIAQLQKSCVGRSIRDAPPEPAYRRSHALLQDAGTPVPVPY